MRERIRSICGREFAQLSSRNRHRPSCKGPKSVDLGCRKCGKKCSTVFNQRRHESKCSGEKEKPENSNTGDLICRKCAKEFSTQFNRQRHEKICRSNSNHDSQIYVFAGSFSQLSRAGNSMNKNAKSVIHQQRDPHNRDIEVTELQTKQVLSSPQICLREPVKKCSVQKLER